MKLWREDNIWRFDFAKMRRWFCLCFDCGASVPAGDPFIVHPGPAREALESLRMLLLDDAILDLRALRALEEKSGRDDTLALMKAGLDLLLTFDFFPDWPGDA